MNARTFVTCIFLLLPIAAWCQTAAKPVEADFQEGEQWTWRQVDELTQLETLKLGRQSVMHDGHLMFLGSTTHRFFAIESASSAASRQWPLQIGKTWKHENDWRSSMDEPGTTAQNAKVVAYETVTVPAGSFLAFRIECKGSWNITDVRNMKWSGPVEDTYWYSPEVKADIMHRRVSYGRHGSEQWRSELTSYVPASK